LFSTDSKTCKYTATRTQSKEGCTVFAHKPMKSSRNFHQSRCPGDNIGYACETNTDCSSGKCTSLVCAKTSVSAGQCVNNNDCVNGNCYIAGGQCIAAPDAYPCATNADCISSYCYNSKCLSLTCLIASTPVRYDNGSTILAEDVEIGDVLRGEESNTVFSIEKMFFVGSLYGFDDGPKYFTGNHKFVNPLNRSILMVPNVEEARATSEAIGGSVTTSPLQQMDVGVPFFKYNPDTDTIYQANISSVSKEAQDGEWVYTHKTFGVSDYPSYVAGNLLNGGAIYHFIDQSAPLAISESLSALIATTYYTRLAAYIQQYGAISPPEYSVLSADKITARVPISISNAVTALNLTDSVKTDGTYKPDWLAFFKGDWLKLTTVAVVADNKNSLWYHLVQQRVRKALPPVLNYPYSIELYNAILQDLLTYYNTATDF